MTSESLRSKEADAFSLYMQPQVPCTSVIPAQVSLAPQLTKSYGRTVEAIQTHMTRLTSLLIRSAHPSQAFKLPDSLVIKPHEQCSPTTLATSQNQREWRRAPMGFLSHSSSRKTFAKLIHSVCTGHPELTNHSNKNLSTSGSWQADIRHDLKSAPWPGWDISPPTELPHRGSLCLRILISCLTQSSGQPCWMCSLPLQPRPIQLKSIIRSNEAMPWQAADETWQAPSTNHLPESTRLPVNTTRYNLKSA